MEDVFAHRSQSNGEAHWMRTAWRGFRHDWVGLLRVHPKTLESHRRDAGATWVLGCTVSLLMIPLAGGCSATRVRSPDRLDKGYVIVLPGIEGSSFLNANVAKGLVDGGIPSAIDVYDWTAGSILLFPVTLRGFERNKHQAQIVAQKIMDYQDRYPGRPVHLIGHSGGGGVAVLALEALPSGRTITGAVLLAPALAPDYDLRRALRRAEFGIYNYYSPHDVGFLKAGTTVLGTIDGRHTSAAGARGFTMPWGLDKEDRQLYGAKLHQQRYTSKMAESGHSGGHTGWANRQFVAQWLAPVIYSQIDAHTEYAADVRKQATQHP